MTHSVKKLGGVAYSSLALSAAVALALGAGQAQAAACSSAKTANWAAVDTWAAPCAAASGPVAGDTVTIGAHTITVAAAAAAADVTVGAGGTLAMTEALTLTGTLTNNGGTITTGAKLHVIPNLTNTAGTTTLTDATTAGITGNVTLTAGTLFLPNTLTSIGGKLETAAGSTLNFGTGALVVTGTTSILGNVAIPATATIPAALTSIGGDLTYTTGTLTYTGTGLTVGGKFTVSAGLAIPTNITTKTLAVAKDQTLTVGKTLTVSDKSDLEGGVTFVTGGALNINAPMTITQKFTASESLTMPANVTSIGGLVTVAAGKTLTLSASTELKGVTSVAIPAGATTADGTLKFDGVGTKVAGVLKLGDVNSSIILAEDTTIPNLDLSAVNGKAITFTDHSATITSLTLPTANAVGAGAAKTVIFAHATAGKALTLPTSQIGKCKPTTGTTDPAIDPTSGKVTFTTGTVSNTLTCTINAVAVPAAVDLTGDKPAAYSTELK